MKVSSVVLRCWWGKKPGTVPSFGVEEWRRTRCSFSSYEISSASAKLETGRQWREYGLDLIRSAPQYMKAWRDGVKKNDKQNYMTARKEINGVSQLYQCVTWKLKRLHMCTHDTVLTAKHKTVNKITDYIWAWGGEIYWFLWCSKLLSPRSLSLPSSPCFHLVEAWVGVRGESMFVLFRALHPLWCSAGESIPQLIPSPAQALRPHLVPFQADLNL